MWALKIWLLFKLLLLITFIPIWYGHTIFRDCGYGFPTHLMEPEYYISVLRYVSSNCMVLFSPHALFSQARSHIMWWLFFCFFFVFFCFFLLFSLRLGYSVKPYALMKILVLLHSAVEGEFVDLLVCQWFSNNMQILLSQFFYIITYSN